MTATIHTEAYFQAAWDSRRSYSSFVKIDAEKTLWSLATKTNGSLKARVQGTLIDIGALRMAGPVPLHE
jgi:hypothetical protein